MQCVQDGERLFVRLDRGADLFGSLSELALSLKWHSAHISGIGALENIELGFFGIGKKSYKRKIFAPAAELLSLDGNLSQFEGKPFWHIHGVFGDENFQCFGGHLFAAQVAVTAEINVRLFDKDVTRAKDPLLQFNQVQLCSLGT